MIRSIDPIHAIRMGCCVCALTLASCSDSSSNTAHSDDHAHTDNGHEHADSEKRSDVYTGVRGIITFMPSAENPDPHMKIHHTHIPHFLREDGTVNLSPDNIPGMKSMTMGFPAAQGVDISSFKVDDKVEFTFRVNWGGSPAWEITEITKLDPDTEIDFTNTPADPSEIPSGSANDDHSGHDHDHDHDHTHDDDP